MKLNYIFLNKKKQMFIIWRLVTDFKNNNLWDLTTLFKGDPTSSGELIPRIWAQLVE